MKHAITDLQELKSIELDIMKKIHSFCADNDIRYCLTFGTLLGAVRHKGFIPWDDDIDIFMPRPDYEKFLANFRLYGEKHHLYIASSRTKHYFARTFLQVCDDRTTLIEPWSKEKRPRGVFVDVWPLDGLPDNRIKRWLHEKKAFFERCLLIASLYNMKHECSVIKKLFIALLQNSDPGVFVKRLDRTSRIYAYEASNYIASFSSRYPPIR